MKPFSCKTALKLALNITLALAFAFPPAFAKITRDGQGDYAIKTQGKKPKDFTYAPDAIPGTDLAILASDDGKERIYISRSCETSRLWLGSHKNLINYGMLSPADRKLLDEQALDFMSDLGISQLRESDQSWLTTPPAQDSIKGLLGYIKDEAFGHGKTLAEQATESCRPLDAAATFGTANPDAKLKVGDVPAEQIAEAMKNHETLKISDHQLSLARKHPCRVFP